MQLLQQFVLQGKRLDDSVYVAKRQWKKTLRETQTLPGGAKKIRPTTDPLPGGAVRPKFNQLEMATTFAYRPSLVKVDARNFELSWQQTHKHKETGPITIHCAAKLSTQCNKDMININQSCPEPGMLRNDCLITCTVKFYCAQPTESATEGKSGCRKHLLPVLKL